MSALGPVAVSMSAVIADAHAQAAQGQSQMGGALIAKGSTGKYIDMVCSAVDPISLCDDLRPLKDDEPVTLYSLAPSAPTAPSTVGAVLAAVVGHDDLLVKRYRARLRPAEAAAAFAQEIDTARALWALLGPRAFADHTSLRTLAVGKAVAIAGLEVRGRYYVIVARCSVTVDTLLQVGQLGGEAGLCSVVDHVLATLVRLQKGRRYHLDIKTENILRCPGQRFTLIDWDRSADLDQLRERYSATPMALVKAKRGGGPTPDVQEEIDRRTLLTAGPKASGGRGPEDRAPAPVKAASGGSSAAAGPRPYGALMYASPVAEHLWTGRPLSWSRRTASMLKEASRTSLSLMGARRLMAFVEEHVRPSYERALAAGALRLETHAPRMDLYSLGIVIFVACHTDGAGIPWAPYAEFVQRLTASDADTGFADAAAAQKAWRRLMKGRAMH